MFMFGRKEIKKEYYLKVGKMFIELNPWQPRVPYPPSPTGKGNLNMRNVAFTKEESKAWKSTYSNIKILQDLLGGEVYKVTSEAERVL